jgi:hypothetical protein
LGDAIPHPLLQRLAVPMNWKQGKWILLTGAAAAGILLSGHNNHPYIDHFDTSRSGSLKTTQHLVLNKQQ